MNQNLTATIVIATKNRKDELRVALRSALLQTARPEVLVIDDGSDDGTASMVTAEFPTARLLRYETSRGCVVQRNEAAKFATGQIIFSIDDDAEFSSPHVVEQVLDHFNNPLVVAVAIPYIEPHKLNHFLQTPPCSAGRWVAHTFIGTAYAIRRAEFTQCGGFCAAFVHQGEESDLAIRLFERNQFVVLARSDHIVHYESPKRDTRKMDYYGARNLVLFQWRNAPFLILPFALLATTVNAISLTWSPRRLLVRLRGVLAGYVDALSMERRPVGLRTYLLWRSLKKQGPRELDLVFTAIK